MHMNVCDKYILCASIVVQKSKFSYLIHEL